MSKRFRLKIDSFPNDHSLRESCIIIYGSADPKLMASMNSTPYEVGRSFSEEQKEEIFLQFKNLGIEHRLIDESSGEITQFKKELEPSSQASSPTDQQPLLRINKKALLLCFAVFGLMGLFFIGLQWFSPGSQRAPKTASESFAQDSAQSTAASSKASPGTELLAIEFYEAKIVSLEKRVQIRKKNQLEWENAELGMLLAEGDRVRTYDRASCLLRYKEGSSIQVSEDSLLVVGKSENLKLALKREVALENGSLRTKLKAHQKDQQFRVQTSRGTLEMQQKKDGPEAAFVETILRNDRLNVRVAKGAVRLSSGDQEIELQQNQQVFVTPTSVSEPVNYSPPLRLNQPQDGTKLRFEEKPIGFSWEEIENADYEFILATDKALENRLFDRQLQENTIELQYLDKGFLYWQVTALSEGIQFTSPIYRLHVE